MAQYPIYQIDAFTSELFKGNPAAVVVLDKWLSPETMQSIASENNLSETAFIVKTKRGYHLRWFTPISEVDLCGHATLSAAHVIFTELDTSKNEIEFTTEVAGTLTVTKDNTLYTMDFPARAGDKIDINTIPDFVLDALSAYRPIEAYQARDLMLVYDDPKIVRSIEPDYKSLHKFDRWIIITAKGDQNYDCISRFFCAGDGIDEDPVTGSAHCTIIPYWARILNKNNLKAYQASERGGEINAKLVKDRVFLSGLAVTYLKGHIEIPLP
jgi:predicted PhzF superfamily epimerase YddE/YHI9